MGSEQEPDRGPHPRTLRNHHPFDSELLGEPPGVERRPAPERDHGVTPDDPAPLDGVDPGRVRHVLVHHLDDPDRGPMAVEAEALADVPVEGDLGARALEPDLSAREPLRVELAEDEVRVRHRRPRAASAVAGGAGFGAGTRRSHPEPVHLVDAGDGAAARPDLHHLDDGDADRQAASLEVPVSAGDLEGPGPFRGAVLDQADLRRGAAHVEGKCLGEPAFARHVPGENRPSGGPRLHEPDGNPRRLLDRGHAPARHHQVEGTRHPTLDEALPEAMEIPGDERSDVGVRARRRKSVRTPGSLGRPRSKGRPSHREARRRGSRARPARGQDGPKNGAALPPPPRLPPPSTRRRPRGPPPRRAGPAPAPGPTPARRPRAGAGAARADPACP